MRCKSIIMLLVSISIVTLVAVTGAFAASVTLQVWNSDANPATLDWYNKVLIPAFQTMHPGVNVVVTRTPWGTNYNNKIVTSYAAGVGPDIIYGGAEYVDGFVENGFVIPIDNLVSGWADWKDIIPPTLGAVTYKGHTYGVPLFMDYRSPIINRQVFLNGGYNPDKPPTTWIDFVETAKRLTRRSGDGIEAYGMFVGSGYQDFNHMVWQNGGSILNDTKTAAAFNEPAGLEALTFWVNAVKEVSNGNQVGGFANLIQGRVAMLFQENLKNYVITARNSKMNEEDIAGSIIPPIGNKVAQSAIYTNWMGIGSQSKYKDLAWDFLKLHFSMEHYIGYNQASNGVPTRLSMLRTDFVRSNPWLVRALTLAASYGRATWTAVEFARLRDTLGPEYSKAMKGQIPPREALDNAAKRWNEILSEKR